MMSKRQPCGQPGSFVSCDRPVALGEVGDVRTPKPNCSPHTSLKNVPPTFWISAPLRHSSGASFVPFGFQPPPSSVGLQLSEPRVAFVSRCVSPNSGQNASGTSIRSDCSGVAFGFISTSHWSMPS